MIKCQKVKDLMLQALYGELPGEDREQFEAHLGACPACAAEYSVLGATLEVMDRRERPDPGVDFWDGYWERLERRMERGASKAAASEPASFWRRARRAFAAVPRWAYQASAALALVIIGVLIGRAVFVPSGPGPATGPTGVIAAAPQADPTLVRANDYVQRSKVLLLGLVNFDPAAKDTYGLNLPRQKQISRELLSEAAYLKPALRDSRNERLRELVADLEVILLQIANLESENDLEAVDLVRTGVDKGDLLLQINLSEMAGETKPRTSGTSAPADKPKV